MSANESSEPLVHPRATSLAAEQHLLGSALIDATAWERAGRVETEDLTNSRHRFIHGAMEELSAAELPLDTFTVAEQLKRRDHLEAAGGIAYLAELARDTPNAQNVRAYADVVREYGTRRRLSALLEEDAVLGNALGTGLERELHRLRDGAPTDRAPCQPPIHLVDLLEFVTRPTSRWLVRGILPPDSLVVVFGPPKGGKTFSTTDLLMHAAHGMDWYGHPVKKPLRVAFLAGEGRGGLKVRLHAWLEHHDTASLDGAFKVLPMSLSLPDRVDELIEALKEYQPDVVVPDTLNAFFGPGDENSTQDMTRFVASLRRLREALRCTVVVLHHTSIADGGRERGSGVLRGAADVIIQVGKDESGSGSIGFQVVTGRDIEPMEEPVALRLRQVDTDWLDEDGEPLTTCVVGPALEPVTLAGRGSRPLGETQSKLLAIARELAARAAPDSEGSVTLARSDVAAVAKERGMARQSISSAWPALHQRKHLHLVEPGSFRMKVR